MKRKGYLFHKITEFENLRVASHKAMRGKRDKVTIAEFYFHLERELLSIQNELIEKRYSPKAYTLFEIYEPKVRQIACPAFRDRVVHHAICNHLEPIFERRAIYDSFACRLGKGTHAAVVRCQHYARRHRFFLKCDIRKYFASIDHVVLKSILRRIIKDADLLNLLDLIIDHEVPLYEKGKGVPIGNLTSQHFANLYLGQLDHFVKDRLRIKGYVRYMDDFICFAGDKPSLHALLDQIQMFVNQTLKLELKSTATRIAPVSEGIPFLGFRVFPQVIRLQRPHLIRMRRTVKAKERDYLQGMINEQELFQSVGSIIAHVSHVNSIHERRKQFERSLTLA